MKKLITTIALSLFILTPGAAFALNLGTGVGEDQILSNAATKAGFASVTETSFSETLGVVVKAALSLVGVIFLILMIYAGFLWLTARGKEDQIDKAQDIIRSSIIGLIITVGAYSIVNFILPRILEKTTGASGSSQPSTHICAWAGSLGSGSTTETANTTNSSCKTWCRDRAGDALQTCTLDGTSVL